MSKTTALASLTNLATTLAGANTTVEGVVGGLKIVQQIINRLVPEPERVSDAELIEICRMTFRSNIDVVTAEMERLKDIVLAQPEETK